MQGDRGWLTVSGRYLRSEGGRLSKRLIWLLVAFISALIIGSLAAAILLLAGRREQTLYQWSASERIEGDIRIERQLELKKRVEDSPYRFTVRLLITNLGEESISDINVEETLPEILCAEGGVVFTPDPVLISEDGKLIGWSEDGLEKDGMAEFAYSIDLSAEFSEPQLLKIEGQFEAEKVKFIGIPGKIVSCQACDGGGRVLCGSCSGAASSSCPKCGAKGSLTCATCNGTGNSQCSTCKGHGYYSTCCSCGAVWPTGSSSCPSCGGYRYYT